MWCFFVSYRLDAAKRQTAGIKFTHRPKIRFFAPQGRLVTSNLAGTTDTWVRLAVQNFTSIAPGGGNAAPKIIKISIFGTESPRKGDSLNRFPQFLGAFIRLTILRQCFKFHVVLFTGYGVIAEKPRVGKLGQIFPYTLQEKLYVGSKNEYGLF